MNFDGLLENLKNGTGMKRAEAAMHLGKLNDKRAIAPLIEALKDTHLGVRNNVAYALGELGSPEAIVHLIPVLRNDPEEWVRKSAAKALGMLKARDAVADLYQALNDPSRMVRKSAARSLGQIGSNEALAALKSVSGLDTEVTLMAQEELEKLNGNSS